MIVRALDTTLAYTKQMCYIKDVAGSIVMRNIASSIVSLQIAEGQNLVDYTHERSIDTDTYNQIKLVRDNKSSGKRDVFLSRDSSTIQRWGLLQYFEVLDEKHQRCAGCRASRHVATNQQPADAKVFGRGCRRQVYPGRAPDQRQRTEIGAVRIPALHKRKAYFPQQLPRRNSGF